MHILLTGARAPACLEWARAFRAAGWEVSVGDSLSWPLTRASNAVDHFLRLPEARHHPQAWGRALEQAVHRMGIDLILPTCEEAFYLSHIAGQLSCQVLVSDFSLLHRLHHKAHFAWLTQGWPAAAPPTSLLSSRVELDDFIRQHATAGKKLPWVFKPAYSRFAKRTQICPTERQLENLQPSPTEPWVAQRYIAGREHCSYSLFSAGRLTAHACYHPRHRVGSGSGIWFEPSDPPAIRSFVEAFGQATNFHGQVAFDFIEDSNGQCHVLECNPRATSGVHLFDDQPQALVQALLGEGPPLLPTGKPRMVGLAMLLFGAPRKALTQGFWQDYQIAHDVIGRPGDTGPLWAQLPGLLEICARALRRRCGLLAAATTDIEWDGQPL